MTLFDQKLFLIRDEDAQIRAFFNVCPHPWSPTRERRGDDRNGLVCPYHAWTYDLKGRLLSARGAQRTESAAVSEICLSAIRVERLRDFYFVNLDRDAPSLAMYAGELEESLAATVPDLSDYRLEPRLEYIGEPFECNWKVMMDNQLECYHCENAHPGFAEVMDLERTRNDVGRNLVVQTIPTRPSTESSPFPYNRPTRHQGGHVLDLVSEHGAGTSAGLAELVHLASATAHRRAHDTGHPGVVSPRRRHRGRRCSDPLASRPA